MYKVHHIYNNTDIYHPDTVREGDLFVQEVGHSSPPPGYSSKHMQRHLYMLHYVVSGRGQFLGMPFEAPCILFGTPRETQQYSVQEDSPLYEQYWILFGGSGAPDLLTEAGFPLTSSVIPCPHIQQACQVMRDLQSIHSYVHRNDNLMMLSGLYQLMALQAAQAGQKKQYSLRVQQLISHIHEYYSVLLTEDELADIVHVSTRYMHRLFKTETGVSPIQYLNTYRIHCAKKLLEKEDFPINVIASSCGFATPNYFCTVFRKYNGGISPLEYRKSHQKTED